MKSPLSFSDVLDDVLVYVCTVAGIVLSAYLPLLKGQDVINIEIGWWRIFLASFVAMMIVGQQEHLEPDADGSKARARAGRKKRLGVRMSNAFAQGVMWSQIINISA